MYGGRTDGVAAVASSAAWLCEWKQLDVANNDKKATPRWKRYWSKESSPQGLASEQSQNFFVCAVRWGAKDHSSSGKKVQNTIVELRA